MDAFGRSVVLALALLVVGSEKPPTAPAECDAPRKGRSLLQVPPHAHQAAVSELASVEEVAAEPSPPGTVNWDGYHTFEVKRKEVDGFAAEVLFRLPLEQMGPHNATHVFFPFRKFLSATFVRDFHGIGSYEYGFARWIWDRNELSAVGEGVVVGAGEKLHTLSHDGAWDTESLRKVREEQASRWSTTDAIAKSLRFARSAGINTWVLLNKVGTQMLNASIDPNVIADVKAFIAEPGLGPLASRMAAVSANLTEKHDAYVRGLSGVPKPSSTAANCFHLHEAPELTVTQEGFWWPLDRKLTSVRGQTVFVPLQRFDIMMGVAMARITDGMLEVYQGAASISNILDPSVAAAEPRKAAQLFVGRADGALRPIPPEGRHRPIPHSRKGAALTYAGYTTWQAMPEDFDYLSEPPEANCPTSHLEAVKLELEGLDLFAMAAGSASSRSKLNAVRIMTNMIDCTGDFMRADTESSHAYGAIEALVFLHGMLEFASLMLQRGWNTIPGELFCGASGCIPTTTTTTTTTTERSNWWWPW